LDFWLHFELQKFNLLFSHQSRTETGAADKLIAREASNQSLKSAYQSDVTGKCRMLPFDSNELESRLYVYDEGTRTGSP
jgi:hypothetical protein